jgi:hypothetical protein
MKSPIRAIRNRTPALLGQGAFHSPGIDKVRFRSSPLGRALVVLVATILVLIVSAIVLPPKASQVRSGENGGEAPVTAPH